MSYHHAVAVGLRSIPFSAFLISLYLLPVCHWWQAHGWLYLKSGTWTNQQIPPRPLSTHHFCINHNLKSQKQHQKTEQTEITSWQSYTKLSKIPTAQSPATLPPCNQNHFFEIVKSSLQVSLRGSPLGLLAHPQVWRAHAWIGSWDFHASLGITSPFFIPFFGFFWGGKVEGRMIFVINDNHNNHNLIQLNSTLDGMNFLQLSISLIWGFLTQSPWMTNDPKKTRLLPKPAIVRWRWTAPMVRCLDG